MDFMKYVGFACIISCLLTYPEASFIHKDEHGNLHIATTNNSQRIYINGQEALTANHFKVWNDQFHSRFASEAFSFDNKPWKWMGAVLAPSGNIYAMPMAAEDILEINTTAHSVVYHSIKNETQKEEWSGAILVGSDRIYSMPYGSNSVMMFSEQTKSTTFYEIPKPQETLSQLWFGGVLADNKCIYGIPFRAKDVLVFNTTDDSMYYIEIHELLGHYLWRGGVKGPNGKIYGIPSDAHHILVIDPSSNSTELISLDNHADDNGPLSYGKFKWAGGILAANGMIYGIPDRSNSVLIINPFTNEFDVDTLSNISETALKGHWHDAVIDSQGRIFCLPWRDSRVIVIDTKSNTYSLSKSIEGFPDNDLKWGSGALGRDGKIYGIPAKTRSILVLDPAFYFS